MWRVEFSPCGWASLWYVVKGYYDNKEFLKFDSGILCGYARDFGSEESANEACIEANENEALLAAIPECGK